MIFDGGGQNLYPAYKRLSNMKSILIQNLTLNSNRATRGLNKPESRFAGYSYSLALRPEINGRLWAGCSVLSLNFLRLMAWKFR